MAGNSHDSEMLKEAGKNRFQRTRLGSVVSNALYDFLNMEVSGSIMLLIATALAVGLANSPLSDQYFEFWDTHLTITYDTFIFDETLLHVIDDGLMAMFFFIIGLEIKREVLVGELSKLRQALLPIIAAVGGMVIPAVIYTMSLRGGPGADGWGVPMATDIAFALGVMTLLGKRVPTSLKVFLTALAIVDDIGAVLVIAFFYTSQIEILALVIAAVALGIMVLFNIADVQNPWIYAAVGLIVWLAFLESGVHATLAGVLTALTIPARARLAPITFVAEGRQMLDKIEQLDIPGDSVIKDDAQQHVAQALQAAARYVQAPLQRIEHALHPVTTYIILPLFALANAGVVFDQGLVQTVLSPVGIAVALGLIVGKQVGITGATFLAVKLKLADLPPNTTWRQIWGVSWLGAIGFTMALFISNLAFRDSALLANAKAGVMAASLLAGLIGFFILRTGSAEPIADTEQISTMSPVPGK